MIHMADHDNDETFDDPQGDDVVARILEGLEFPDGDTDEAPPALTVGRLPEWFWQTAPELGHIRQASQARLLSPEAVLCACLARIAALSQHNLDLPAIVGAPCGLSMIAGLVGPPSAGKSAAAGIARNLLPAPRGLDIADGLPIGSGEGIAETFYGVRRETDDKGKEREVRALVRHNAYFVVDEGQVLGDLSRRSGSTLGPTLRQLWSGVRLGQANASAERRRDVPEGHYVIGVVIGIQPDKAGPLLDDDGGGTPQRIVWATALAPRPPDVCWPGPLTWAPPGPTDLRPYDAGTRDGYRRFEFDVAPHIRNQIREDRIADTEGTGTLPAHYNLRRLKVAGCLALLLHHEPLIDSQMWDLAGAVMASSEDVMAHMIATREHQAALEREAADRAYVNKTARAAAASADATADRALDRGARAAGRHVHNHSAQQGWVGCNRSCITRSVAGRDRKMVSVDELIDTAIAERWIVGDPDGTYLPGDSRPV